MKHFFWIGCIVLADQVSKLLVVRNFDLGESVRILPFFYLTFVANTGTAFGLFQGVNSNSMFIIISVCIIMYALYLRTAIVRHGLSALTGFILVLGGAFGNLIDRIVRGQVIDFLDFLVWPVFNIADSCICIGTGLLIFSFIKEHTSHASSSA